MKTRYFVLAAVLILTPAIPAAAQAHTDFVQACNFTAEFAKMVANGRDSGVPLDTMETNVRTVLHGLPEKQMTIERDMVIAIYNNADTTPTQVQTQTFNLCIGAN